MPRTRLRNNASGRIFISYRREETAYPAGWLFDRLSDRFGAQQIFKDIDSIEPGDDFVHKITAAVGSCDVLLALIGDGWLTVTDVAGRRRLDDVNDFVRVEIEAALSRNVRVIPILVEGAAMPRTDELPPSLAGLVRRQALELSPSRFTTDLDRLLRVLEKTLAETPRKEPQPDPPVAVPAAPQRRTPRPARKPNRVRAILSTPARIVAAIIVAVFVVLLLISLATRIQNSSDGDSESDEESSEEESSYGHWPPPAHVIRVFVDTSRAAG